MASNFAALSPIDPKFSALKDFFPFSILSKVQEAGSILYRAYLVTVRFDLVLAVCTQDSPEKKFTIEESEHEGKTKRKLIDFKNCNYCNA